MRPRRPSRLAAVLAASAAVACRTAPPPRAPLPAPPPAPAAAPVAATPAPSWPAWPELQPPLVRVLLQADDAPVLTDPGRPFAVACGDEVAVRRGPLRASLPARPAHLQVAAFAAAASARALVVRLQALAFAAAAEAGGDGLHRAIVTAAPAESGALLAERLARAGFADAIPVADPEARVALVDEAGSATTCREFRLAALDPQPLRLGGRSLRGSLTLQPRRGGVAVINVLNLEEYLRGVVPAEMGPRAFPALEALKAQAVAARTYAVAHLGDHADEGYDLCDSQACQVYAGADAEHELSDRAVRATAGEIATWAGAPIDAMYHSTCGGHTEDAAALLPERAAPYLRGVACTTEGSVVLGSGTPRGDWVGPLEHLAQVAEAAAAALGVAPQPAPLAMRLGGHPAAAGSAGLVAAFALPDLAPLRVAGWGSRGEEEELTRLLATFRLPLPERTAADGRRRWELALVVRLAQLSGAIRAVSGTVVATGAGAALATAAGAAGQLLDAAALGCERRGDSFRAGPVAVPAGSPATAWYLDDRCVAVEAEPRAEADGASAWSWWARELDRGEVGRRLAFPVLDEITVTRRGVSGRALALALAGGGERREVGGWALRRALDLPDTRFVVQRRVTPQGTAFRFLGRGWGHGIGMCQNGAYGMALAGAGYREVLASYYTGIEVVRWQEAGGRP